MSRRTLGYEVHEHCFVSGPRTNDQSYKFSHSHLGGDKPHQHAQTGPASYTIDKVDWFKKTGLVGGGCKKFTVKPAGMQMPVVELEDWQKSFIVVIGPPTKDRHGDGPGFAPAQRMILGFGMKIERLEEALKESEER